MREIAVPGESIVDLDDGIAWEISIEAPGYWAEPRVVPPQVKEKTVLVRLVPTGTVRARLTPLRDGTSPQALSLRFQTAPARPGSIEPLKGAVDCPIREEGKLECAVPAGNLDLRFRSEAHAPVYFWGVEVAPGKEKDLGSLQLKPGASVSGWIELSEGGAPSAECRIKLSLATSGPPADVQVEERLLGLGQEAHPNERGFFQLIGVAPGLYSLSVTQPGFAAVSLTLIEVREGLETQLADRITLERPATLDLVLDPGVEPYGQPWRVRLVRRETPGDPPVANYEKPASREGSCRIAEVPPGRYELAVLGDQGSTWYSEMVDVQSGASTLQVFIPVLQVEGLVTRGGDPLLTTLWLGRRGRRLRFDSDSEGRFGGSLPEEGTWDVALMSREEGWRVTLPPVEVRVPKGKTKARLEIAVPDTTLEGEVVDDAGRPVLGAQVNAFSNSRIDSRVRTDEKGEFAIRGLPPGPVTLSAMEEDRESGWVQTALTEGETAPWLHLVLRRLEKVRGRVVSPAGGVPGATVYVWPAGQSASRIANDMSGPGGEVELQVPEGVGALELIVLPPGFGLKVASVPVSAGRGFEIPVEPYGGTLILEKGPPGLPQPLLVHEGVLTPLQPLEDWARRQGAVPSDAGRLVVPNISGGAYSLCRGSQAIARLEQGAAPPPAACASGVLAPFGELVLRAPE